MNYTSHTKACLANALVATVTRWAEASDVPYFDFRIAAQNNLFLAEADEGLKEGYISCQCHVAAIRQVMERFASKGESAAWSLAEAHYLNATFSAECYYQLGRWIEGKDSPLSGMEEE